MRFHNRCRWIHCQSYFDRLTSILIPGFRHAWPAYLIILTIKIHYQRHQFPCNANVRNYVHNPIAHEMYIFFIISHFSTQALRNKFHNPSNFFNFLLPRKLINGGTVWVSRFIKKNLIHARKVFLEHERVHPFF